MLTIFTVLLVFVYTISRGEVTEGVEGNLNLGSRQCFAPRVLLWTAVVSATEFPKKDFFCCSVLGDQHCLPSWPGNGVRDFQAPQ